MQRYRDLKILWKRINSFFSFHEIGNLVNGNSELGIFKYFFQDILFIMVSLIIPFIL